MIARVELRGARGLEGVAELFRQLGYPVALTPVSPEILTASSPLAFDLKKDWGLFHGARIGPVDLFFLQADPATSRQACSDFVDRWRRWNALSRVVVVTVNSQTFSIHGVDRRGRVRRLDVDTTEPTVDSLERLALLRLNHDRMPWEMAGIFERALDRDSITRRFFDRFRRSVDSLAAELGTQCAETPEALRDEALLILSRILFLYFLQEKGWLDGSRSFLSGHLRAALHEGRSLFQSVLRPLFFGCLNTPQGERDPQSIRLGRIPYLNGGLFERSRFEQQRPSFTVSNDLLSEVIEDLFEQVSFCADERDEEGLHVDPEMLGKVFESLMADDQRLASGTFYTPKAIVDSMVREAIIARCGGDERRLEAVLRDGIAPDGATAAQLIRALEGLKVIDPACGSGAFLLASLHLIEELIRRLSPAAGLAIPANLRQKIVERSLFGVDLKPEAVRLCELRLWLSIVSSSKASPESVDPLPNLDRNILQGNALLGPVDFLGSSRLDVYRRWSYALSARRDLFASYRHSLPRERPALCRAIRESDQALAIALLGSALKADREELQRINTPETGLFGPVKPAAAEGRAPLQARIASTERLLARAQEGIIDFFAFDLHFADVFAGGGFDLVIGNPPWVRTRRIEPGYRRMLAERYELFRSKSGFDQSDLCLAFWEKSFAIAADGGVVAMLLPSKVMTATYGSALRARVMRSSRLVSIEDWSDRARELFDADTFPVALTVRKSAPRRNQSVQVQSSGETFAITASRLSSHGPGSAWRVVPPGVFEVMDRIRRRCRRLEEVLRRRPLMGVKTGLNSRYFLPEIVCRNGSVHLPSLGITVPAHAVARCVRGRDVERWKTTGATWMLLPPRDHSRPSWLITAAGALGLSSDELQLAYVQPEHFGIKVAWKDVSRGLQAVVIPPTTEVQGREFAVVPNQTLYLIEAGTLTEGFAISAILNSTVFGALAVSIADQAKDSHSRYFGSTVAGVPFPRLDSRGAAAARLASLARRAHRGHDVASQIDVLVAELYRVNRREFGVLRQFLESRLS